LQQIDTMNAAIGSRSVRSGCLLNAGAWGQQLATHLFCNQALAVRIENRPENAASSKSKSIVMSLPHDPHLLNTCSDVVMRFLAHDTYGTEQKALNALSRRAPGFSPDQYRAVFDVLCRVYTRAVEAIPRYHSPRPNEGSQFSQFEDIDFDECMKELDEIAPGEAMNCKQQILNWVIFWHYLK
jgi:hypothetical protein